MSIYKHKDTGKFVQLTGQDEKSVCHFVPEGAKTPKALPSHEFYRDYEGATADDLAERKPA